MRGTTVYRFKPTWAWNSARLEAWLEQQAAQGLHLESANWIGMHRFVRGAPRQTRYRMDFSWGALPQDYTDLFADAGWERVDSAAGWHYWRNDIAGAPEIFTDGPSRARKFRSLRTFFTIIVALEALITGMHFAERRTLDSNGDYLRLAWLLLLALLWARLTIHIRQLETDKT